MVHSTPNYGDTSIHRVKIKIGMKTINFKLVLSEIQIVWFQEIVICFAPTTRLYLIIVAHCEQLGWVAQFWFLEKGCFGKFWTKIIYVLYIYIFQLLNSCLLSSCYNVNIFFFNDGKPHLGLVISIHLVCTCVWRVNCLFNILVGICVVFLFKKSY